MKVQGKANRSGGTGMSRRAATGALAGLALGAPQLAAAAAEQPAPPTPPAPDNRRKLTLGLTKSLQTLPVIERRVSSPDIDPAVTTVYGTELFLRQLRDAEFDAAEMSISSLMIAASRGDTRFIGLPVFTSRRFFHTRILVRRDSGIKSPADLRGKKVGVPEYHQTAVMWIRGVLQDEFGVGMQDMQIWTERAPGGSLASALGFKPPSYVKQIPPEKNIGAMMLSGELDAALTYIQTRDPQPLGDRSTADLMGSPQVTMLFPDQRAEGIRYFEKTGMHHINHCMVMRRSLFEQDASLPRAVVGLFDKAAAAVDAERLAHVEYHYEEGRLDEPTYKALAVPVVRHGVAPNRRLLETMCRYSHQQALSTRLMTLQELFPGTDA